MTMHTRVFDDITAFLGTIPPDEYEQRRRIRDCRSVASYQVARTGQPRARALLWMVTEFASEYGLAPADLGTLEKVANVCRDLQLLSDRIAELEASDGLA